MIWPFRKAEDWRSTGEEKWEVCENAGDYVKERLMRKWVRFPDGATEWRQFSDFTIIEKRLCEEEV